MDSTEETFQSEINTLNFFFSHSKKKKKKGKEKSLDETYFGNQKNSSLVICKEIKRDYVDRCGHFSRLPC